MKFHSLRMMNFVLFVTLFCLAMGVAGERGVVKVIPSPDYPYGLTHDGTNLWLGSSSSNPGGDYIWKIDPADGTILGQIPVPHSGTGSYTVKALAYDGSNLWVFKDSSGTDRFYKLNPADGTILKTITSPINNYIGGMAYANGHLWFSHYYSSNPSLNNSLVQMDTAGVIVSSFLTQGEQPMGVAFDGQYIWCAEDTGYGATRSEIYQYDPVAGTYTGVFIQNPDDSPRDMTYDGNHLWLVGYYTKSIYEIEISGGTPIINTPVTSLNFNYVSVGDTNWNYFNVVNDGDETLNVDTLLFTSDKYFSDISGFPLEIPVGSSAMFKVSFAPTAWGSVPATMTILNNDPTNSSVAVELYGKGLFPDPTLAVSPANINFGDVWVGMDGSATQKLILANAGNQNLEIVDLILTQPEFAFSGVNAYPINIAPDDTFQLNLHFTPSDTIVFYDTLAIGSTDPAAAYTFLPMSGTGVYEQYNTGYTFWQYQVGDNPDAGSYQEYEVDGLQIINDINNDGIHEVVIATENYWLMCLNGGASGMSDTLWTFSSYISNYSAGSIGGNMDYGVQDAIDIAADLNGDGKNDVVIGTGGGNEHVYAVDGTNGALLWSFGTDDPNSYGLGDFEAVDAKKDFNGDGVVDVLAIADGNQAGNGYHSAYCFNGTDGTIIWQYNYPGPAESFAKTVISINDITYDNVPDAIICVGNNGSPDTKKTYGIDGATGFAIWDQSATQYNPKEAVELPVPGETPDVVVAEYFGMLKRMDGETGIPVWSKMIGSNAGIIQIDRIGDVNADGIDDILVASFAAGAACVSGLDGNYLWTWPMAFQYDIQSIPDMNGDAIEEVLVCAGDNNPTSGDFYCISGKGDSLLFQHSFAGDRPNVVAYLPSIDGNVSPELVTATKYGQVLCFSGGLNAISDMKHDGRMATSFELAQNYPNPFNPETTIGFTLPAQSEVTLRVFNVLGQEVAAIFNHKVLNSGAHKILFHAGNLPSGVYVYRLSSKFGVETRKMMLMK